MAGFNLVKAIKNNIWLTVFSTLSLIFLLTLASWQVERLKWKNALIAVIDERVASEPIKFKTNLDIKEVEFRKTSIKGRFLHAKEIHLSPKYYNQKIGFHVLTPFKLSDGSGYVLVNRGWVPDGFKEKDKRKNTLANSEVTINGTILRPQRRNVFTPENDLVKNYWFWVDIEKISEYAGVKVSPFVVVDEGRNVKNVYPIKLEVKPELRNDHLQYAITWFSLAITLVIIYIVYIVKNPGRK